MNTPRDNVAASAGRRGRRLLPLAVLIVGVLLLMRARATLPDWLTGARTSTLTQEVVVEQVRSVAKLVSTEMTLRDVVIFENSRYGFTKRGLYVVTGRVLAGIDLEQGTRVTIDHDAKRVGITLPPARILAVDVVNVRTYDEHSGLLNPFNPDDRDAIHGEIRARLIASAAGSGLLQQADTSARRVLRALLSRDGYTVDVGLPAPSLDIAPAPSH